MNSEAQKKPVYISQIVIKILSYAVLICGCLMVLIPIVVILLGAFKDSKEFANSGVFEMPKSFAFDNFKTAFFEGKVMGIELPKSVTLKVVDTPPSFKGDTVSGGGKPATLETGLVVTVPVFVEPGEDVVVDTRTGLYLERAKK